MKSPRKMQRERQRHFLGMHRRNSFLGTVQKPPQREQKSKGGAGAKPTWPQGGELWCRVEGYDVKGKASIFICVSPSNLVKHSGVLNA